MFITFDPYYSITSYNNFIATAKENGHDFTEYVSMKAPYYWYIEVTNKQFLPIFLKYKIAASAEERYLLAKLVPLTSMDEFNLKRRSTDKLSDFEKFVSPKVFRQLKNKDYACLFRYSRSSQLIDITRESGLKIWDLGKIGQYNLAITFSKYIRNYIFSDQVLIEKKSKEDFARPGMFEYEINLKKLLTTKLINKYIHYSYYEDGQYFAVKQPSNKKQK